MSEINYPIMEMKSTAQKIRANASEALSQHNTYWQQVQDCISPLPGFMQSALNLVLMAYDQRLRQSFQSQLDYATWLENAADTMNGSDQTIAHSFQGFS